jgi:hypothetical protein
MAVGLVLKFAGMGKKEYDAVGAALNINQEAGTGDWPAGLISHAAGPADDGSFVVSELWESRDAQGRFMQGRLGAALGKVGITSVPQMTWFEALSNYRA